MLILIYSLKSAVLNISSINKGLDLVVFRSRSLLGVNGIDTGLTLGAWIKIKSGNIGTFIFIRFFNGRIEHILLLGHTFL